MRCRPLALLLVFASAVVLAACDQREVENVVKVTDVKTGFFDAGIVDGQNKLVPSVSFHLQNVSSDPIESVQINAVFRPETVAQLDAWITAQPEPQPSRTQAMRQLVSLALESRRKR
jgi:hypothetical protein